MPDDEKVLGIIGSIQRPYSFAPFWAIVMTDKRFILAKTVMNKQNIVKNLEGGVVGGAAGAAAGGILGGILGSGKRTAGIGAAVGTAAGGLASLKGDLDIQDAKLAQFNSMSPDGILNDDKDNTPIQYSDVTGITIVYTFLVSMFEIRTSDGKRLRLNIRPESIGEISNGTKPEVEKIIGILKPIFGDRIVVEGMQV